MAFRYSNPFPNGGYSSRKEFNFGAYSFFLEWPTTTFFVFLFTKLASPGKEIQHMFWVLVRFQGSSNESHSIHLFMER